MPEFIGFIGFIILSGAVLAPIILDRSSLNLDLSDGAWEIQVALSAVYGLALLMMLKRTLLRSLWSVVRASKLPIAFFVLALVSTSWSIAPELSIRRAVALGGVISFMIFLLIALGYERTIRVTAWGLVAAALASVFFIAVVPALGIHDTGAHTGNWKGAFLHKNLLGREMALASGIFLTLAKFESRRVWRRWWIASTALAMILVVGSRSATGIVTMLVLILIIPLFTSIYRKVWLKVVGLVMLITAGLLSAPFVARITTTGLALLGRDSTLTGRDTLWHYLLQDIAERPWFGYGYQAFWGGWQGFDLSTAIGWRIGHAHNGYLDVLLSLGLIGLTISLAIVVIPWIAIMLCERPVSPSMIQFGAVITASTILISVSDSVLIGPNNIFFALLIFQSIAVSYSLENKNSSSL